MIRRALVLLATAAVLAAQGGGRDRGSALPPDLAETRRLSLVLGRPTDTAATLSVLSEAPLEGYCEFGPAPGAYARKTPVTAFPAGAPVEVPITGLAPGATCHYRLRLRKPGEGAFSEGSAQAFTTQRRPGQAFTFALQGDSHPERAGKMFDPALYARTLRNAAADRPDFYLLLGDDFSIERQIERGELTQPAVDAAYARQRPFLGLVGAGAPVFLVNGNHEQAARYLLDGTESNAAVLAGRARARFFPLPYPDGFYSGNPEPVAPIGRLGDYAAWTWGDALFVTLDPYWHAPVPVDNRAGEGPKAGRKGGKGARDLWQVTLGEAQYRWLTKVLLESRARWKFVFAHHVNGTGRGGVEEAGLYEWGGRDRRGEDRFAEKRPGWPRPIHALFVKAGVTIFFQGHDHLYARQELDGVVYQTVPSPADPTYQAFNREAYRSGDILPNAGHLRVRVGPDQVRVEYVRAFLPGDEGEGAKNGQVAHAYVLPALAEVRR